MNPTRYAVPTLAPGDRVQLVNSHGKFGRVVSYHGRRVVVRWDAGDEENLSVIQVYASPDADEIERTAAELREKHYQRRRMERD